MLESNRRLIQNLNGIEIWLFILSRLLLGFGVGALAMMYFPVFATYAAWPAIAIGLLLFIAAARGLFRKKPFGPTS